jgi:hypothetical protein
LEKSFKKMFLEKSFFEKPFFAPKRQATSDDAHQYQPQGPTPTTPQPAQHNATLSHA